MNFAALLAVIAAAAFTLPLVVRAGVALGASRGVGVLVSLALAGGLVVLWIVAQHSAGGPAGRQDVAPVERETNVGSDRVGSAAPSKPARPRVTEVEESVDASL